MKIGNEALSGVADQKEIFPPNEANDQTLGKKSITGWWYRLTAPPEPSKNASSIRKEANRQARLLSTVVFFLMLTLIIFLPATFFIPNQLVILIVLGMLGMSIITLLFNRAGKTTIAGIIVVTMFELALIAAIVTTNPLDVFNLPLFDLLIISELLAVSLLPSRNVFLLALFNVSFIWADLTFQPHTSLLTNTLQTQFYNSLARPAGLQLIVAVVAYLWVRSTTQAIARADRAEVIAALEHQLAEQKHQLEIGIQQILKTHIAIANGDFSARAPLTQESELWQIANSLNTLLARFQRSTKIEHEYQRMINVLADVIQALQDAERNQTSPHLALTGTPLDPLIIALQGKTLTPYQHLPVSHQRQLTDDLTHLDRTRDSSRKSI